MRFLPLPHNAIRFVAIITALLLGWLVWGTFNYPEALWAPGNLSRFHADIADCKDCHQPFRGTEAGKCIACHTKNSFAIRSKPTVSESHQKLIAEGKPCTDCHTEHRGELAQITIGALVNPHGEFVFRATGTHSCSACHDFSTGLESHATLLDNAIVRHLMEEGKGAHRPGKMTHCLACHTGGRLEVEEEGDEDD